MEAALPAGVRGDALLESPFLLIERVLHLLVVSIPLPDPADDAAETACKDANDRAHAHHNRRTIHRKRTKTLTESKSRQPKVRSVGLLQRPRHHAHGEEDGRVWCQVAERHAFSLAQRARTHGKRRLALELGISLEGNRSAGHNAIDSVGTHLTVETAA